MFFSLFGLCNVVENASNGWLVIVSGWPLIVGVVGIVHTTVKAVKEKNRFENEMSHYQKVLQESEQKREEYIHLVNTGQYFVKEEIVEKKENKCDFDNPDGYYINGIHVRTDTFNTADCGDIIHMYGVQDFGIHLMVLQKRKDLSKQYEIRTVKD